MNIEWDAQTYARNFSFVHEYGADVLSLVEPEEGALALDLGCGNGNLTAKLAEMGFRTIGIDASEEMLALARKNFPNLHFERGDALDFSLEEKAGLIFSNAVFHWIDERNQDALAKNLFANLKPGGILAFEFGGKGCAESVHSALEAQFKSRGLEYERPFYFPTISQHAKVLEENGFSVRFAALFDRPTPQAGEHGIEGWVRMFDKKPFEGMERTLCDEIILAAEESLKEKLRKDGTWFVDYVRIRMKAVRL